MSVLDRVKRWRDAHRHTEQDAPADTDVAMSRETGGDPDGGTQSTTGTGENETFVGRVAGLDEGYAGETGAEARSEHDRLERERTKDDG
ncbi:hypothetical protein Kfla_3821 [Kribbella flavida DSM 17836]|uniref:Uncharacterized protein n=1 Tax=Kribbella flavida (strain DSM 17836 / JCM 10339 / NBRC 14399) TaxID=479435 RepID=D2PPV0_KRIFD|nr:hypothetical protein [Kribbella flavida]ADB32874.1 hypothetical protein Kfla_3821 [Kribbella flavida DSM 17836]